MHDVTVLVLSEGRQLANYAVRYFGRSKNLPIRVEDNRDQEIEIARIQVSDDA